MGNGLPGAGLVPRVVGGVLPPGDDQIDDREPRAVRLLELSEQRDVLRPVQPHTGEGEEIQAVARELGDLLFWPLARVGEKRLEVIDDGGDRRAALGANAPEVDALDLRDPAGGHIRFQVECRIPERPGAGFLAGGAAVGADLRGENVVAESR